MNSIFSALVNTPLWVWAVLAYLLFTGLRATKNRMIHPFRLFMIPIIFMIINYKLIFIGNNFVCYMLCATIGLLIGFVIGWKTPIIILHDLKRIKLPGNYYTIVLLVLFFIGKYVLGYLRATDPSMIVKFTFIDTSMSGLLSGYFLGTSCCYLAKYYQRKNLFRPPQNY